MAVLDIVILSIVAVLAIIGLIQGLIRELAQVLGMIVGALLAAKFAVPIAAGMPPAGWSLILKTPIAAILILAVTYVVFYLIGFFIRKLVMRGPLKTMDRLLGMTLGIIKGAVLITIAPIIVIVSPLKANVDGWTKDAPVARKIVELAKPLIENYQEDIENAVSSKVKGLAAKTGSMKGTAQLEIEKMAKDLGERSNPEDITNMLKELTPEARSFLEDLVEKTRDGAKDIGSSVDVSKLTDQLPMDDVAKALGKEEK